MLLTFLILLLLSNGLTVRPDTSILYSRVGLIIIFYSLYSAYTTFYMDYLKDGISLYGGLFNVTPISHAFQMFILLMCGLILLVTAFYPKEKYIIHIREIFNIKKILWLISICIFTYCVKQGIWYFFDLNTNNFSDYFYCFIPAGLLTEIVKVYSGLFLFMDGPNETGNAINQPVNANQLPDQQGGTNQVPDQSDNSKVPNQTGAEIPDQIIPTGTYVIGENYIPNDTPTLHPVSGARQAALAANAGDPASNQGPSKPPQGSRVLADQRAFSMLGTNYLIDDPNGTALQGYVRNFGGNQGTYQPYGNNLARALDKVWLEHRHDATRQYQGISVRDLDFIRQVQAAHYLPKYNTKTLRYILKQI